MTTFTTDTFAFPYPDASEPPNGPQQLQDLATASNSALRGLAVSAGVAQDGVLDATDCVVTEHAGSANRSVDVAGGTAFVDGLLTLTVNANVAISAAHATLPRIDRIVLSDTGVFSVLTGTATAGATLDNLTGAASPTGHGLLLADVRVPATDTVITNDQIRDRRQWARGARATVRSTGSYSRTSNVMATIDSTLVMRIECSGAPVRVTLDTTWGTDAADKMARFDVMLDGSATGLFKTDTNRNTAGGTHFHGEWEMAPAAGSHTFAPGFLSTDNATNVAVPAFGGEEVTFRVVEDVSQNVKNNATTSG